jgi:hypothetical protein
VSPQRLTAHLRLFKLGWQADPSVLPRRAGTDHLTVETAAWLAEINEQLADLAAARSITLVLMGGNAAALRMEAAKQRGSRDNDYLTDASGRDIDALMDDFAARFAELAPLFVPKRHIPAGAQPLPLQTYYIPVPAIFAPSRNGQHPIKVEFHIDIAAMPPSEAITREHFALPEPVRATVPKVPYQVALKMLTLADPPIGLDPSREDALPRQVYDLDELTQAIDSATDFAEVRRYADVLYAEEAGRSGLTIASDEPWSGIERRMEVWAPVDTDSERARQVEAFQVTQMSTVTRRSMAQWRARFRRVQLAARCAAMGEAGYEYWRGALALEARVPDNVRGKAVARAYRRPVADITGVAPGAYGPRTHLWEGLASAGNLGTALVALAADLPPQQD